MTWTNNRANARRREGWHAGVVVALIGVAVYLNSLPNGFTNDDVPIIVTNPVTQPDAAWYAAWAKPYWPNSDVNSEIDVLYRPLTVFTYAIQRRLSGENPLPFHAVNVVLHALVCVGVFWLAARLGCASSVAALVALIFAVHPIHCEVVANVIGRAELLAAAGGLLALWGADRWCDALPAGRRSGRTAGAWLAIVAGCAVSVTSKESGIATAGMVMLWIVWRCRASSVVAGGSAARSRTEHPQADTPAGASPASRSARASTAVSVLPPEANVVRQGDEPPRGRPAMPSWRQWMWIVVPLVAIVVAYLLVRFQVCGFRMSIGGQRVGPGNPLREAGALERVLTPFSLLGRYVALMVWPARLLLDYALGVIPATRSVVEPYFLLGAAVTVVMFRWALRSVRHGGAGWLVVAGFVGSYIVTSNTFLLIDIIFAERFFYAPSIWLCVAFGLLLHAWAASAFWRDCQPAVRRLVRAGLAAAIVALTVRTLVRNPDWVDNRTLYDHDLAAMTPGSRSANTLWIVGRRELDDGNLAAAEALLIEAIETYDAYPEYYYDLGCVYLASGQWDAALAMLEKAQRMGGRNMEIATALERARRMAAGADVEGELAAARLAAQENPGNAGAIRAWALAAEPIDPAEAVEAYRRWTELRPDDPAAHKGLAFSAAAFGDRRAAVESLRRVLSLSPDDWEAHTNLAVLLIDELDPQRFDCTAAVRHARRAVELNRTHWQANVNLAEVLAACGDPQEAAALFEQLAAQCPPGSSDRRLYEDRARFLRKQ